MLIVPMSGMGKRFLAAGYTKPKPLILVDGRPIIAHVLDLYPGEEDVLFICNEEHLATTDMRSVLLALKPKANIIGIPTHDHGPVWAIKQAYEHIPDDAQALISYCDFTGRWSYEGFRSAVRPERIDGCIPAYKGFHPHLLGPGFYGHMRWDADNLMLEIQEKKSFTDDKMEEYGAVGTYWFRTGAMMKKYFDEAIATDLRTGTELFCSMPFNLLVRDGRKVLIYEMEQFCQWGTPEDLEEYEYWSRQFAKQSGAEKGTTDIPAAREAFVKPRETDARDDERTRAYWARYFASVPWHPYEGG